MYSEFRGQPLINRFWAWHVLPIYQQANKNRFDRLARSEWWFILHIPHANWIKAILITSEWIKLCSGNRTETFLNRKADGPWQDEQPEHDEHVAGTTLLGASGVSRVCHFIESKTTQLLKINLCCNSCGSQSHSQDISHTMGAAHPSTFSAPTLAIIIKVHKKRNSAFPFATSIILRCVAWSAVVAHNAF